MKARLARLRLGRTRFRPLDLAVLAAAGLLVAQAPLSVVEAAWVPNLDPLARIALAGLIAGYLIERTRVPAVFGLPLGMLLGFEVITWVYSHIAPGATMTERVDWLGGRVGDWFDAVASGGVSNDAVVFALAMSALAWLLGLVTAWLVFRDNSVWLAVVFNGLALLMNLSYASASMVGYVGWFAFASCLLLATQHVANRAELWRRAQLRVNWRVVANVLLGTALAVGGLLSLAWALPSNVSSSQVAIGWNRLTAPYQGFEGDFDRWFAALNGSDRNARGLSFGRTLAPRGAFDLGDTPVLQVKADMPVYLRATTADRYASQAITSSETTTSTFDTNTDLLNQDTLPLGRGLLTAQITVLASRTTVAFAPDAPLRFSMPIELDTRGDPNDVATIRLDTPVQQNQQYTVVSAVSTATNQELRAAGEDYPEWVRQRYLPLPRTVPRRVIDLSHEVTSGVPDGFDKALTLEGYLRDNFTYTTHVDSVPTDQDWVDYFLFESKQGYCDYFATAMVVMLRAEGVPARVASGFAPGDFDQNTGLSTVRENHAHSWVEAYFPRYGWITFEPSSIRALPPRIEDASGGVAPPPEPSGNNGADADLLTPDELDELLNIGGDIGGTAPARPFLLTLPGFLLVGFAGLLVVALLVAGVVAVAWRRGLGRLNGFQRPYAELVKLGRWSGALRTRTSDTPFEVAERMGRQVPRAQSAIGEVTDAYVEATYAGRAPGDDPRPTWLAARRDVIRGLFGRRLGSWFGEDTSVALPPRSHPELLRRWGAGKQNSNRPR
ncbi:MAG TPA: transglutaminase domain-containing protein [Chloroflexota bacterium]|jgi:transglutaminase-like putative cysteine protease